MNTLPLDVLVITPIRASVATRVAFATAARERAKAKGLSVAQWSIQRLLAPTTFAADMSMTFDIGGEIVPTRPEEVEKLFAASCGKRSMRSSWPRLRSSKDRSRGIRGDR